MTHLRAAEIAGTATIAYVTTLGAAMEADVSGWVAILVPIGVAAVVAYFSSRVTTESRMSGMEASFKSEISGLKAMISAQGDEFRRYYRLKGPHDE